MEAQLSNITYRTIKTENLSDDELHECCELYNNNYGIYLKNAPRRRGEYSATDEHAKEILIVTRK